MNARQARRGVVTLSVVGGSCLVLLSAGCAKSGAMSCADYGQKGYSAVSYTHLDVYKRQAQ